MRVELEQRSTDWHAWRAGSIGGSSIGAIMGLNPWKSPYQQWLESTGKAPPPAINEAMQRGIDLEDEALALVCHEMGMVFQPACYQSDDLPFMRASLDGIDASGKIGLEIKCPGEATHLKIINGDILDMYVAQCHHGQYCAELERTVFASYRPEYVDCPLFVTIIERDQQKIAEIVDAAKYFHHCIQNLDPPPLLDSDYQYIESWDAIEKASHIVQRLNRIKAMKKELEFLEKEILDYTDDGNSIIGPLKITRVIRKGNVDWESIRTELALDESYVESKRKPETSYFKYSEVKK